MAKAKLTTPTTGPLGGIVFQGGRYGQTVRQKVSPVQPKSDPQVAAQARRSLTSKEWRHLNDATRHAWSVFAAATPRPEVFGSSHTLSGFNWFCSWRADCILLGLTPGNAPPTPPTGGTPIFDSFDADAATLRHLLVRMTATPAEPLTVAYYLTAKLPGAAAARVTDYRWIFAGALSQVSPLNIFAAVPNVAPPYSNNGDFVGVTLALYDAQGNLLSVGGVNPYQLGSNGPGPLHEATGFGDPLANGVYYFAGFVNGNRQFTNGNYWLAYFPGVSTVQLSTATPPTLLNGLYKNAININTPDGNYVALLGVPPGGNVASVG